MAIPKLPTTIIFKNTLRKNSKVKIKVIRNRTIDQIISAKTKIPGIPVTAEYLEIGVGSGFEKIYKKKYRL